MSGSGRGRQTRSTRGGRPNSAALSNVKLTLQNKNVKTQKAKGVSKREEIASVSEGCIPSLSPWFPAKQSQYGRSCSDPPEFLREYRQFSGGVVRLQRSTQVTRIGVFARPHAARTKHMCHALIDIGSCQSFISERVKDAMIASGAASLSGFRTTRPQEWSGFHGPPLQTSRCVFATVANG